MDKMIVIEPDKCTGCSICEMICSFDGTTFNPNQSKIKILKNEELGIDLPVLCQHCQEPICVDICPIGAIKKNIDGIAKIDYDTCRGCKACVIVCPYGAIRDVGGKMLKCDLCDGDPRCAKWCPTQAIRVVKDTSSEMARSKKAIQFLIRSIEDGR
jgi:carbon-monoxide dehydrogenase iron sulfur subunit